jgi:hypothetical protein
MSNSAGGEGCLDAATPLDAVLGPVFPGPVFMELVWVMGPSISLVAAIDAERHQYTGFAGCA